MAARLSPEKERRVVDLYLQRVPAKEIASEVGIHPHVVGRIAIRNNVQRRRHQPHLSKDEKRKALYAYLHTSEPLQSICDRYSIDRMSLRNWADSSDEPEKRRRKGRYKNKQGYIVVLLDRNSPFLPMTTPKRHVLEHRLIMAQALGRILTREELVHHKNGIRSDNRLENLQLLQTHPPGQVFVCGACGSHDIKPIEIDSNA